MMGKSLLPYGSYENIHTYIHTYVCSDNVHLHCMFKIFSSFFVVFVVVSTLFYTFNAVQIRNFQGHINVNNYESN